MTTTIDIDVTTTTNNVTITAEPNEYVVNINTQSGGGGVQSVTGTTVDNTDAENPVVNVPTLQQITDEGATTDNTMTVTDGNGNETAIQIAQIQIQDDFGNVSQIGTQSAAFVNGDGTGIDQCSVSLAAVWSTQQTGLFLATQDGTSNAVLEIKLPPEYYTDLPVENIASNYFIPFKPSGDYTLATLDDIPAAITQTSDLTNDGADGTSTYVEADELGAAAFSNDYNDLSNKPTIPNGTVTSVAELTLGTSGTDLSSTIANGTTTPVITLNVPTASASNRGALSSTDWNTFNNKQNNLRTFNTTQGIYYFEEFLGQSRHVDFGIGNGQGSSAYTATITNRTNQQGVAQHTTNANSTGQAGFTFVNGAFQFIGGGVITLEAYINITTLSTLAERFYTFFGYAVGINFANILNTIVITYDEGGVFLNANASPNFKCVTRAGSTATTTITSIPIVASQWYKLRIVINANASSVEFYIDNVLVATHTTNIPLTTTAMYIANGIVKTTGTTARSMQTDYFMYEQIFTNPR